MKNSVCLFSAAIGAVGILMLSGCGKVPTWNELTNQSSPSSQPNPPTIVSPPVAPKAETSTPTQTPLERAKEVIANFQALTPGQVNDEAIASLTSLEEGAELITEINAQNGKVTNEGLANLHRLTYLKVLELVGTSVGDKGCEHIGQLPSLEQLSLTGGSISDEGIAHLANMTNLRRLVINSTKLTQSGWEIIGQLPTLQEIWIENSSLDDDGLNALCNASTLEKFYMSWTSVTDKGLFALRKLERLQALKISYCKVTCEGLGPVLKGKGLKNLIELRVQQTPLTSKGAAAIGGMDGLEILDISNLQGMDNAHFRMMLNGKKNLKILYMHTNPGVTCEGILALKGLKDLELIDLSGNPGINNQCLSAFVKMDKLKTFIYQGTGITDAAVAELKKKLPEINKPAEKSDAKADAKAESKR